MGTPLTTRQLANEFYNQSPRLQTTKNREAETAAKVGRGRPLARKGSHATPKSLFLAQISPTNSRTTRVSRVF